MKEEITIFMCGTMKEKAKLVMLAFLFLFCLYALLFLHLSQEIAFILGIYYIGSIMHFKKIWGSIKERGK